MEVGDYRWNQVSMWNFTPKKCVEKYIDVNGTTCVFYLVRITEVVIKDKQWKTEIVENLDEVPMSVLQWKNNNYRVKSI